MVACCAAAGAAMIAAAPTAASAVRSVRMKCPPAGYLIRVSCPPSGGPHLFDRPREPARSRALEEGSARNPALFHGAIIGSKRLAGILRQRKAEGSCDAFCMP